MVEIHPDHKTRLNQLGLSDFSSFMRHFDCEKPRGKTGALIQQHRLGEDHENLSVFFKVYEFKKPSWYFVGRRSKARCEYENYQVFQRLKIPAAQHLAYGEDRDVTGRLKRAFILTQTIEQAETLVDFFTKQASDCSQPETRKVRRDILQQLAERTRCMHQAGFYHHDLVWRNILVTSCLQTGLPKLWFIDCPRGRFCRWPVLNHRQLIKDLGSLDKTQARYCSRTERLFFFLSYLQQASLDPRAKQLISQVLHYRRHRWPDDWNE